MSISKTIDKLREGIIEANIPAIENAFKELSGEDIVFGQNLSTPYTLHPKVSVHTTGEVKVEERDDIFTMKPQKSGSSIKKPFVNNFDPSTEPLRDKEDSSYDNINDDITPIERNRPIHRQVESFCQDCKKIILVDPQFKKDPHYCDFIKLGQPCPHM